MKVTFIMHSSFLVELEHCALLFDYYEGDMPMIDLEKPLYVFASHSHGDHFSHHIFALAMEYQNIHYILSDDIPENMIPDDRKGRKSVKDLTLFVSPHNRYTLDGLTIETLESTDMGVAYLITCEGKSLYHAGDLNCWVWEGGSIFQNEQMKELYQKELQLLSGRHLDAAFVPLDPRQEREFGLGMLGFLAAAEADSVFPMHMWGDFRVVPRFCEEHPEYADKIMRIEQRGQSFLLP